MHESGPAMLIAFEEQDNLGIGYIASLLLQHELGVKIIDFRIGEEHILQQVSTYRPVIIGFSVIFQYYIHAFKDLITYLREHGIKCHFTAGGHYPSLRPESLLNVIPELDSVVLFEGEQTFLALVQALYTRKAWQHIPGIAYRRNGSFIENPLHQSEKDLDNFPIPVRRPLREYALGKKYATILAGRGCYYNCSFCSIREFYHRAQAPLKRMRRPEMVVKEMKLLYEQLNCSIFMFQDDDFPVSTTREKRWSAKFCELLVEQGLSDNILWKINCRPDEVDKDIFEMMKNCGLFSVYLGIEDGTDQGLGIMNKHMDKETIISTIATLKMLGIRYDFGFMLFHPSSTYQTVWDNLDFLETICGDGSSPITFCKMLPYAGTAVENILKKEGRLKGNTGFEDYDFIDRSFNYFYAFMSDSFDVWMGAHDGLLNIARWTGYYLAVYQKYFPITSSFVDLHQSAHEIIAQSNLFFIRTIKILIDLFHAPSQNITEHTAALNRLQQDIARQHSQYTHRLAVVNTSIESMVE